MCSSDLEGAHEAPAIALRAAQGLGPDGARLVSDTRVAFASGMQIAMLVGALALAVGALYVWLRAPARAGTAADPSVAGEPEAEGLDTPEAGGFETDGSGVAQPDGAGDGVLEPALESS